VTARPPFEVQVCVHNSPRDVARCLASVQATLGPGDRLLIVDDGSDAPARTLCEDAARQPRTRLIRRPEGTGFTRAANAGLRAREAAHLVILNSDTVVTPGWLDRLAAPFALSDQIGLVGITDHTETALDQQSQRALTVDGVLFAAERIQIDGPLRRVRSIGGQFSLSISSFATSTLRALLPSKGPTTPAASSMSIRRDARV